MNLSPANTPAEAEKSEPVVEEPSGEEATEKHEKATEAEEQHKPNPKIQDRFDKLTKQREEAKRETEAAIARAEAAERKNQEMEARLNPPKAIEPDAKPQANQFTDAFEYAEALSEWSAENALRQRDNQEAQKKQQADRDKMATSWKDRQATFEVKQPDYQEMIASSEVSVSDPIRDAILESDMGPELLYHLAENPEIAQSWATKSIITSLRELGKLEAKLSIDKPAAVDPAPKPSKAPTPITPIKGSNAPMENLVDSDGNFTGTYQQFRALEKAGKI